MSQRLSLEEMKCPRCGRKHTDRVGINLDNDDIYQCGCGCLYSVSIKEVLIDVFEIDRKY